MSDALAESILRVYLEQAWVGRVDDYVSNGRPVIRSIATVYLTEEQYAYVLSLIGGVDSAPT